MRSLQIPPSTQKNTFDILHSAFQALDKKKKTLPFSQLLGIPAQSSTWRWLKSSMGITFNTRRMLFLEPKGPVHDASGEAIAVTFLFGALKKKKSKKTPQTAANLAQQLASDMYVSTFSCEATRLTRLLQIHFFLLTTHALEDLIMWKDLFFVIFFHVFFHVSHDDSW